MRRNFAISILMCVSLLLCQLAVPVFAAQGDIASNASIVSGCHSADATASLLGSGQIVTNAQAVFLYDVNSDTLMHAWNPDLPVEPASLVKIMTAFVAVEQGQLDDAVTVKQSVLDTVPEDAVSSELVADEVMTLQDLLYCMMVDSGNDAAAMIADHVAGSQSVFVEWMNAKAAELGCANTRFTNVHGVYDEQQTTTARDIGKILSAAVKNEQFSEIFGTVYYNIPATNKSEERKLVTGNLLMSDDMEINFDERVTGGRTGVASDGSHCLAVTAESGTMKLVSVLIGSSSSYEENGNTFHSAGGYAETKQLLDAGFTGYYSSQILYEGQVLTERSVLNGSSSVSLGCASSVSTVLPEGVSLNQLSFRYVNGDAELKSPINKGDVVCGVEVWFGGLCVAYTDLYALNSVTDAYELVIGQAVNPVSWWGVVLIVLAVIAGVMLVFLILRNRIRIRNQIKKWQRKRRWKNRRGGR